jgi:hypothetical protein
MTHVRRLSFVVGHFHSEQPEMTPNCPQCGAATLPGETCHGRFGLCLALEYQNPAAFGAVHHLMVLCYMLQHNAYSREAWLEARNMLAQFVQEGVTPAEIRRQNRARLDSGRRAGSITKEAKLTEVNAIQWTRTIADVRLDNPDSYCADVVQWATAVLTDTEFDMPC